MGSTPPPQPPAPHNDRESTQTVEKTLRETQLEKLLVVIGSQIVASSSGSAAPWECSFQLGYKALPSNSFLRTWRSGEGGHVLDSVGQALLLPADMEHYAGCRDDDLVLKLKWHTVAVRSVSYAMTIILLSLPLSFCTLLFFF